MTIPHPIETSPDGAPKGLALLKQEARVLLRWVVAMLLCVLMVRIAALDVRPVQGPSMEPNLADGDRVLIWKLPFVLGRLPLLDGLVSVSPGDILVFRDSAAEQKRYVKRLIAQGGAPYNSHAVQASPAGSAADAPVSVLFDRGTLYVNNHPIEEPYVAPGYKDSPERHEVTLDPGELYVLGDNRAVSKDSRRLGPIPLSKIEGRVILRVWPLSKWGAL